MKCRTCGSQMLRPLNLFGVRELLHPDTPCFSEPKERISRKWEERTCEVCESQFAERSDARHKRKTCSTECQKKLASRNLLKGRALYWGELPKQETGYKWAERYRRKWQAKAIEQDAKLNRRAA